MWMTYTFFSKCLNAEETVTILMPDTQHFPTERTMDDLYGKRLQLPAIFLMGDTGCEHNWWLRNSLAEPYVQEFSCGAVCIRGMSSNAETRRFVSEELPVLISSQFPVDPYNIAFLGWGKSSAFLGQESRAVFSAIDVPGAGDVEAELRRAMKELTGVKE